MADVNEVLFHSPEYAADNTAANIQLNQAMQSIESQFISGKVSDAGNEPVQALPDNLAGSDAIKRGPYLKKDIVKPGFHVVKKSKKVKKGTISPGYRKSRG